MIIGAMDQFDSKVGRCSDRFEIQGELIVWQIGSVVLVALTLMLNLYACLELIVFKEGRGLFQYGKLSNVDAS